MAHPKHRSDDLPTPDERSGGGGEPEPAADPNPKDEAGEEHLLEGAAPAEEAAPEFFVMEPEPPEKDEEFVLAGEEEGAPVPAGVGAEEEKPPGGAEEQEWLLRGGDEVMEANEKPLELGPKSPEDIEELEGVPVAVGGSDQRRSRMRRFFKVGSIAAAAVLLLSLGLVTLRNRLGEKPPVTVARAPRPPVPPSVLPQPVKPPVVEAPAAEPPPPAPAPPPTEDARRTAPAEPLEPLAPTAPPAPTPQEGPISIRTPTGEFVLLKAGEVLLTLRNGNFFTGRVYRIGSEQLTLRVPGGEIVFEMKTLAKIVPLAGPAKDSDMLAKLPDGYVELHNGNRIWGKILEDTPEYASIAFADAKITIPRGSIKAVVQSAVATVGIAE
ncbi:MAG TPA: hypothetical protein VFI25_00010 [Planctomycetota bacterium]|jgi:hypothetical protein|nr:hypothetical protein [Planctomycetota bacterium]